MPWRANQDIRLLPGLKRISVAKRHGSPRSSVSLEDVIGYFRSSDVGEDLTRDEISATTYKGHRNSKAGLQVSLMHDRRMTGRNKR